jgi:hypothetical protein
LILKSKTKWGTALVLVCTGVLFASDKKDKPKPPDPSMVDSGTFGIFVKGQRVMTEKFTVQQENGVSIVKSQLQESANSESASQKSELQMTSGGELLRYEWSDHVSSLVVTPNNEFLLEKITVPPSTKTAEQPFLMPNTSAILDNNFFIDRQLLAWRYLATNCQTDAGTFKCQQGPVEFGVLVPQDRSSLRVRMELAGREKVTIRGAQRELLRINLTGEELSWALWVDDKDQFKLIRVLIPDANTEVVRD